MTVSLEDIPAVSPGGLSLTATERLTLLENGVLNLAQRDGSTLILWLSSSGRLYEQYYPAAPAAALDRWREEYPDAPAAHRVHDEPEQNDSFAP
ncbi:hypothetical protein [Pantoea vagans]|uniref:hypothetical protein n=1 Tax=Pantoea vagans TaxID=470934 RepID=UPI0023AE9EE6|nr:hypothetical protein [Pantoea vagans]MDE8558996.1 hypothetical protein [Pantoea vagans]MDE8579001.1 hypothetical protein [Pantoea vagans]